MVKYSANVKMTPDYRDKLRKIAEINNRSMIKQVESWINQDIKKVK